MRIIYLLLLGAFLAHAVRLSDEPDQLLQPVLVEADPGTICTQNCDLPSSDCVYGAWSEWGPCWSASSCGGPYFTNRTRVIAAQAIAYGTPCTSQALIESRTCTDAEQNILTSSSSFQSKCAIPCQQSPWVVKTPCDVSQAQCPPRAQAPSNARIQGRIIYSRDILVQPQYGGALCGPNEKFDVCYFDCKYDCQWGPYQNDGCELPCAPPAGSPGQNRQRKSRKIQYFPVNGGAACTGDSVIFEGVCENINNLPTCCPGCTEGPWTDWTPCSISCGYGGSTRRTRVVTTPSEWYANPAICGNNLPVCGATEQTQSCCTDPCAEDCICGDWTQWSDCYTDENAFYQCGAGVAWRSRVCLPPQNGGQPCPAEYEEKPCFLPDCPVDCEVTDWSAWSDCPATCGVRLSQRRTRTVVTPPQSGGSPCPDLVEERLCPCNPCPEDCQLSPWGSWGECSSPCGPGTRQRVRDIVAVPRNGGIGCNVTAEVSDCIVNDDGGYFDERGQWVPANKPCDVNCRVGPWSSWSGCSKSCTSDEDATFPGVRRRTRVVTVPPQYHGVACPSTVEEQWCSTQCCPVDMTYSEWSNWTPCTAPCGGGWQSRARTIVNYPRCGGRILEDPLVQYQRCNEQCCPRTCVYHPYSNWSPCRAADSAAITRLRAAGDFTGIKALIDAAPEVSCPTTTGFSYRTREVRIDDPCNGCRDTLQYRSCAITCPQDCVVSDWGSWSECDRQCGWGSHHRSRTVLVPASNGGSPCPCTEDVGPCDTGKPCCSECRLSEWNAWEACDKSCGGGIQSRRRYVNMTTDLCPELECVKAGLVESQSCSVQDCPAPCVMGPWSAYSQCSSSCGLGFQYRTRSVVSYGTGRCEWDYEERPCNNGDCPVPCVYTDFTEWTPCPVTCIPPNHPPQSFFSQYRAKYRISGTSSDCPPVVTEEKQCDPYPVECPQLCQVSEWGDWSECSSPYGWGERRRERSIVTQPTGREICPQLYEIDRCYHEPPSNNCTWSVWSDWSSCSASCRTATSTPYRTRERFLIRAPGADNYTPASGSNSSSQTLSLDSCASTGGKVQTTTCVDIPFCPVDCVMSKWGPWGPCNPPGIRERHRYVRSGPLYGGAECHPCVLETDQCTVKSNDLPSGQCEVGKCLLEVEKELEAKQSAEP